MAIENIGIEAFQIISGESTDGMHYKMDDALAYGIGFFETILITDHACLLEAHVDRINASLSAFGFQRQISTEIINQIIQSQNWHDTILKIIITEKNALAMTRPISYTSEQYQIGMRLKKSKVIRSKYSALVNHKSLNYGESILAYREALACGLDDSLMFNENGNVTESAIANIFIIEKDQLITPPISDGILPGVMRNKIMTIFEVKEESINFKRLMNCQSAFLTNSIVGAIKIRTIDEKKYSNNPLIYKIRMTLEQEMRTK